MVTHTPEFVLCITHPSAHTQSSEHTHTMNTTSVSSGQTINAEAPGEQLRGWCRVKRLPIHGIEGGRELLYYPPPTIPAGPRLELATFGLRIRLYNH